MMQEGIPTSPVGLWETLDDATGKAMSRVEISERGGVLSGRIIQILEPGDPNPLCHACTGDLHERPIVGMTILRDLRPTGNRWSGGTILDPGNGKIYRVLLELEEGGRRLKVRGYIGVSLLGRTQHWVRVEER